MSLLELALRLSHVVLVVGTGAILFYVLFENKELLNKIKKFFKIK